MQMARKCFYIKNFDSKQTTKVLAERRKNMMQTELRKIHYKDEVNDSKRKRKTHQSENTESIKSKRKTCNNENAESMSKMRTE